jgi:hypothetical protein
MMISICDVYDALALKRSYKKDYPPEKIYELMTLEKGKMFEPVLLDRFFQQIGVWPVGTIVALNDGRVAVVREVHEQDIHRPVVEVLSSRDGGERLDLLNLPRLLIAESLNPHGKGRRYLSLTKPLPLSAPAA